MYLLLYWSIPIASASVFIELRTRQAPVPQDRNIIPTRPMIDAFSVMLALITGTFSPFTSVYSCHSTSMWFFRITFISDCILSLLSIFRPARPSQPLCSLPLPSKSFYRSRLSFPAFSIIFSRQERTIPSTSSKCCNIFFSNSCMGRRTPISSYGLSGLSCFTPVSCP